MQIEVLGSTEMCDRVKRKSKIRKTNRMRLKSEKQIMRVNPERNEHAQNPERKEYQQKPDQMSTC